MNISRKQIKQISVIQLMIMCSICFWCTLCGISDDVSALISLLVLGIGSLLVFLWLKKVCSNIQFIIIFVGYILRIFCMMLDLYGRDYFTVLHSGADSEGFYDMASQYYNGNYSGYYTWYPYVIRSIFTVFGQNRIIAQYVNIVFWILAVFVILRICDLFQVPEYNRLIACGLMAFLPNNIILSSILLRESMMIFFDLLGMYYMVLWMRSGRLRCLILAFLMPVPAIILHTASIGMWAAFAVVVALWDKRRKKYTIDLRTGIVLVGGILFLCVLFFTNLRALFLTYLGNDVSIYAITHRNFVPGGSDYLRNMDYQYWYEFLPFTLVRMFYFVCSPLVTECRGIQDYFCVLGDVLPTLFVIFSVCISIAKKKVSRYAIVGVLSYVITVGIFAWGTSNTGTAMRHRGMLWGILIASYCIGAGAMEGNRCD